MLQNVDTFWHNLRHNHVGHLGETKTSSILSEFFMMQLSKVNSNPVGDFNVHHKDWLTNSGGTDRPGELLL